MRPPIPRTATPRAALLLLLAVLAAGCAAQPDSAQADAAEAKPASSAAVETAAEVLQGAIDGFTAGATGLSDELIPAGGHRVDGRLAFAAQPSEDELRALAAAGVRVLDLRRPEEGRGFDQPALAAEVGLDYTNVPVDGTSLADPEVHRAFKEALEADGELVAHCASGNRVGGLYYAYLVTEQGMAREAARAKAKELGMTSAGVESGIDAYLDAVSAKGE